MNAHQGGRVRVPEHQDGNLDIVPDLVVETGPPNVKLGTFVERLEDDRRADVLHGCAALPNFEGPF